MSKLSDHQIGYLEALEDIKKTLSENRQLNGRSVYTDDSLHTMINVLAKRVNGGIK